MNNDRQTYELIQNIYKILVLVLGIVGVLCIFLPFIKCNLYFWEFSYSGIEAINQLIIGTKSAGEVIAAVLIILANLDLLMSAIYNFIKNSQVSRIILGACCASNIVIYIILLVMLNNFINDILTNNGFIDLSVLDINITRLIGASVWCFLVFNILIIIITIIYSAMASKMDLDMQEFSKENIPSLYGDKNDLSIDRKNKNIFNNNEEILNDKENTLPKSFGTILGINGKYENTIMNIPKNEKIIIGRDSGVSNIILDMPKISREHCEIIFDGNELKYKVKDSSSNGTFMEDGRMLKKNQYETLERGSIIYLVNPDNKFQLL